MAATKTIIQEMQEEADAFFEDVGVEPRREEPEDGGLSPMEQLAIAQAFLNAVGGMCSTKEPGNLRDRVNEAMVELYEATGAKSFDVKVRGEKVGTYSLTVSKPTESRTEPLFEVVDRPAFTAWPDFGAVAYNYALSHAQEVADWHFGMTGEMPDGCEVHEVVYPGDPGGKVSRSSLRIDSAKVAEAMGRQLPEVAALMLEGGADE